MARVTRNSFDTFVLNAATVVLTYFMLGLGAYAEDAPKSVCKFDLSRKLSVGELNALLNQIGKNGGEATVLENGLDKHPPYIIAAVGPHAFILLAKDDAVKHVGNCST